MQVHTEQVAFLPAVGTHTTLLAGEDTIALFDAGLNKCAATQAAGLWPTRHR